jgi:putative transposase
MPRANRYIQPGCVYHLTHRCHDRRFLFRFARDRTEYRRRLRDALGAYDLALLNYCITSNHTHLLVCARMPDSVSRFMQKLEGEFAEYYNLRKRRSGAFWDGRYACTMVDTGAYVWNCMRYIDLNMVRAGVVGDPSHWAWCGYGELVGTRQRYRLLDLAEVLAQGGGGEVAAFRANYRVSIQDALKRRELAREPWWTESIAVGRESFVRAMAQATTNRRELTLEESRPAQWTLRESPASYA